MSRSGATARASSTASAASAVRSTGSRTALGDLVEPRERQQILDEHAHARRLVLDARHRLGDVLGLCRRADPEQLGVPADRGQRRAQLVRGVREEAAQALLAGAALGERLLQAREHRVERQAEAADLRARLGVVDAARQVAGGDRAGRRADRVQRAQPDAHDPPGAAAEREQDGAEHESLDEQQLRERGVDLGQRDRGDRQPAAGGAFGDRAVARSVRARRADGDRLVRRDVVGQVGRGGRRLAEREPRRDGAERRAGRAAGLAVDGGREVAARARAPLGPRVTRPAAAASRAAGTGRVRDDALVLELVDDQRQR